jgi:ABC-2 type transport system ATP-binding protein
MGVHGTTMIFASHPLAEVEQLAGKIPVLDSGRLLACDTLAGIKAATGGDTLEESLEILTRRAPQAMP